MSTPYPLSRRADRLRARRAARRMMQESTDKGIKAELAAVKTVLGVRQGATDPVSCFPADSRRADWCKQELENLAPDEREEVCALVSLDDVLAGYALGELPLVRHKTLPHQLCVSREYQVEKKRTELEEALVFLKHLRSRLVEWSEPTERKTRFAVELLLVRPVEALLGYAEDVQVPLAARTARVLGEVCVLRTHCADVYLPRLTRLRDRYHRGSTETPAPWSLSCLEVLERVMPPLAAYVADPEKQAHPRYEFWGKDARTYAAFEHAEKCRKEGCKELGVFFVDGLYGEKVTQAPERFRAALARAREILRERRDVLATTTP